MGPVTSTNPSTRSISHIARKWREAWVRIDLFKTDVFDVSMIYRCRFYSTQKHAAIQAEKETLIRRQFSGMHLNK